MLEKLGREEESRRAVRLVTSSRPSPPRTGRYTTLNNLGTPSRTGEGTHGQTHRRDAWGYATGMESHKPEDLQRDTLKGTHCVEIHLGGLMRKPQQDHTDTHTHTLHTRIHTETWALEEAQPSFYTPGHFQVQIFFFSLRKRSKLWVRGGGALKSPSSRIFPDPVHAAQGWEEQGH